MEDNKEQATQENAEATDKGESQPDSNAMALTAKDGEEIAEASYAKGLKDGTRRAGKTATKESNDESASQPVMTREAREAIIATLPEKKQEEIGDLLADIADPEVFAKRFAKIASAVQEEFSASALVADKLKSSKKSSAQEKTIAPASEDTPPPAKIDTMSNEEFDKFYDGQVRSAAARR